MQARGEKHAAFCPMTPQPETMQGETRRSAAATAQIIQKTFSREGLARMARAVMADWRISPNGSLVSGPNHVFCSSRMSTGGWRGCGAARSSAMGDPPGMCSDTFRRHC